MRVVVLKTLEYGQVTYNLELIQKDLRISLQVQRMISNFMEGKQPI